MEPTLTRSDVEAMINSAIANAIGDVKTARESLRSKTIEGGNYRFVDSSPYGRPEQGSFSISTKSKKERMVQEPVKTPTDESPKAQPVVSPVSPVGHGQKTISDPIGGNRASGRTNEVVDVRGNKSLGKDTPMGVAAPSNEVAKTRSVMGREDSRGMGRAYAGRGQKDKNEVLPETLAAISKTAEGMAKTYVTQEQLQIELAGFLKRIGAKGGAYPLFLQMELGGDPVWGPGGGTSGQSYGKVYVGGRTYTPGARTDKVLQINADGTSSWVAAIQNPMPTGSEQYDVTRNDIHLPGETAGNI